MKMNRVRKTLRLCESIKIIVLAFLVSLAFLGEVRPVQAQAAKAPYPFMAPLGQYLTADSNSEIALARSAAPASISDGAEVMVLGKTGYTTAVAGKNGFLCIVERSWAKATDDPEFWNPKLRAPHCLNSPAATTFLPIFLMKTRLVLAGKSREEIARATAAALDKKELPALEPGAMCYMLSKEQYLNDDARQWHPHLMFYVPGRAAKSWGANLPDSPIIAADDPQERATIFMVLVDKWSDGTPAQAMAH